MRYLQIVIIIVFVLSLLFSVWANNQFNSGLNTDYPTISNSVEVLEISTQDPPEAMFQGLTAQDKTDGDLTDQILVASISHFIEPDTLNVKYVVFDNHNNSATLVRKVRYTDYVAPTFSMETPPVYTVGRSFDLLDHIRVVDCIDGEISDRIRVISNMVNNFSVGNYPVILEVSNSCGDTAQITLWVTYLAKDSTAAVKLHQYIVYMEAGETFEPEKWLSSVTDRNATALSTENVEIQGNLDVNKPGCYQLVYSYDDGKLSGQAPLTVVVTEKEG